MAIELLVVLAVVVLVAGGWLIRQRVGRRAALEGNRRPALEDRSDATRVRRSTTTASSTDAAVKPGDAEDSSASTTPTTLGAASSAAHRPTPDPSPTQRIRSGLRKTRGGFVARLADLLRSRPQVDAQLRDDIEEILLTADIGARTADHLLEAIGEQLDRDSITDPSAVWTALHRAAAEVLDVPAPALDVEPRCGPYVVLMIGVNGVGKTTTLGKLAARHQADGRRVLLVAGDTFRAAASEQLDVWAQRVGCDIHQGTAGSDPSSVIYEGIARARREGHDVVLCDTAGRLHTRKELMDELQKIRRSASKALSADREAPVDPHDIFLVLDATIGQNALAQARMFKDTVAFTGLVVTKLDGTAKGGVVLGICHELQLPVRFIGVGEQLDDLRPFDAEAFCDALLARSPDEATQL
ncbi:MAG: signal recognition particle-docking protein FtsY [Myxococcales bacterium FL481]|nr:MAG: signal recognition particle-docking protein FtsY [Myxococcales bacterium FL481]